MISSKHAFRKFQLKNKIFFICFYDILLDPPPCQSKKPNPSNVHNWTVISEVKSKENKL